ncbi:MAG TPA: ABC transporter substrate-binding protein [Devosiaceae bacterium]|nr:ABC transporter substrate-binding protein [Devosiaceae bacterium]
MKKFAFAVLAATFATCLSAAVVQAAPDAKLRAMLPAAIQQSNVVNVGTDPHNPPYSFYDTDNTTMIGMEHDIADEMGKRLGVTFKWSTAEFASIITAVQAGRFDMGMSGFGDFLPREKVVDEVDYTMEGTGIIVADGNPHSVQKLSDACGLKAATVQGSVMLELLTKAAAACPKDKPLDISLFPTDDQSVLAVRSGRADLLMDTYGVAAYNLEHQPANAGGRKLELIKGKVYAAGYQAVLVSKSNPQLRDAIQATLQAMIADGSYDAIFKKWDLANNELKTITVNDAARFTDYLKLD